MKSYGSDYLTLLVTCRIVHVYVTHNVNILRKVSCAFLYDSVAQLVILRNYNGKVLHNMGLCIAKRPYIIVLTADGA